MKALLAVLTIGLLGAIPVSSARAFEIKVRSENALIDEAAIRAAVVTVSSEIGNNIPQDPNIKVYVYTRAVESKIQGAVEGQMIYFHRVQLTKAFAGTAPYPTRAWLPIKTVEYYGVDNGPGVRAKFDQSLREFFTQMKAIDPQKGVE